MSANIVGFNNNYGEWDISFECDVNASGAVIAATTNPVYNNPRGDFITVTKTGTGQYTFTVKNPQNMMMVETLEVTANISRNLAPGQAQVTSITQNADQTITVVVTLASVVPTAYTTGIVVSSNVATLPNAGVVTLVQATAGTTVGVKTILASGTPATGQVTVTYSASGVPTLTFATVDAITAATVMQITTIPVAADTTIATTIGVWLAVRTIRITGPLGN